MVKDVGWKNPTIGSPYNKHPHQVLSNIVRLFFLSTFVCHGYCW